MNSEYYESYEVAQVSSVMPSYEIAQVPSVARTLTPSLPPMRSILDGRDPIMIHFAWSDLPANLRYLVSLIGEAAERIHCEIPLTQERAKALDKLLEARDAVIRAARTFTPIGAT